MRDLLAFPDSSRVWIYQANKPLPASEIGAINGKIESFAKGWVSHAVPLSATGGLLHDMFLVLVADESKAGASGCSIDSSVRFVKALGEAYQVDFFDRLNLAYLSDETVKRVHRNALREQMDLGEIGKDTLFFDNLVDTKGAFLKRWVTPLEGSWIERLI